MRAEDKKIVAYRDLLTRVLEGDGKASRVLRQSAFDNEGLDEPLRTLVNKVALQPARVTEEDIAVVKASDLSEDQIFELVICAAIGQSSRQYETALEALAQAMAGRKGDEHAT